MHLTPALCCVYRQEIFNFHEKHGSILHAIAAEVPSAEVSPRDCSLDARSSHPLAS